MARNVDERLTRAKAYLSIAESKDSKREAYKKAAEELSSYKDDTGTTIAAIATSIGRSDRYVADLLKWRRSGYKAETPWLMDTGATERAALSHTKKVLTDAPMEQVERIISQLPADRLAAVAQTALNRPGVPEEFAKDRGALRTTTRLSNAVHEAVVDRGRETRRKTRTGMSDTTDSLGVLVEVLGNLHAAKQRLSDSYTAARDVRMSKAQREAVAETLGEVEAICDWYRSFLDSGDRSFEDELEQLLAKND